MANTALSSCREEYPWDSGDVVRELLAPSRHRLPVAVASLCLMIGPAVHTHHVMYETGASHRDPFKKVSNLSFPRV